MTWSGLQPHTRRLGFGALMLLQFVSAFAATPPEPQPVPNGMLNQAPYAGVGLVSARVGYAGRTFGSGSAVGQHVVLTAAHVFFDESSLSWNSSSWTWQRAARPSNADVYSEQSIARSIQVLAGYSSAVQAYSPERGASLEEFNRDSLCLVFYDDVAEGHQVTLQTDAASISGLKMIVGYPAELPSGEPTHGQMLAHGPGGLAAIFRRFGPAIDRSNFPNQVYETRDFTSGPGGSGGPLFSALNNTWRQTGVLVGGASDFSSVLVRQIDADTIAMVNAAIADTGVITPPSMETREHAWILPEVGTHYATCWRENDDVLVASDGMLRIYSGMGTELRRFALPIVSPYHLSEAPNGTIVITEADGLVAVSPETGEILWRFENGPQRSAIGLDGTVYTFLDANGGQFCAIAPSGLVEWQVPVAFESWTPPVIQQDGTIIVVTRGGVKAFRPDGTERWSRAINESFLAPNIGLGPDGTIYLAHFGPKLRALSPDGAEKWTYSLLNSSSTPEPPTIAPDGTIYIQGGSYLHIVSSAGTPIRTLPLGQESFTQLGADGTIYVTGANGVRALSSTGILRWRYLHGGGRAQLSQHGRLITQGGSTQSGNLTIVETGSGIASGTWVTNYGQISGTCRAYNAQPTSPRFGGWMNSQVVEPGRPFRLHRRVGGVGPISYLWRRNGEPLSGHISDTLVVDAATTADAGEYTLTATSASGSITTEPATIAVRALAPFEKSWQAPIDAFNGLAISDHGAIFGVGNDPNSGSQAQIAYGLDASGNQRWQHPLHQYWQADRGIMALDDGGVVLAGERELTVLSSSGGLRWHKFYYDIQFISDLALTQDGDIIVASFGTSISRVASATGEKLWTRTGPGAQGATAHVAPDGTIIASHYDTVRAYSPNGTQLWEQPNDSFVQGFWDPQTVVTVKGSYGSLVGLTTAGTTRWTLPITNVGSWVVLFPNGRFYSGGALYSPDGSYLTYVGGAASPIAVDAANHLFAGQYTSNEAKLVEYDSDGTPIGEHHVSHFGATLLTRDGRWVGANPLAAYKAEHPLANTTSALPSVDGARTKRLSRAHYPLPAIVARSSDTGARAGDRLVLEISVESTLPLTYRWMHGDAVIPTSTGPRLILDPITIADAGTYRLEVTNSSGTSVSTQWIVQVTPASARAGFYRGTTEAGGTAIARISSDDRFGCIVASSTGGIIVRDLALETTGSTSYTIETAGLIASGSVATGADHVALTLPGGEINMLTFTGTQGSGSPRPEWYSGGVLLTSGDFDFLVEPSGHWVWRATVDGVARSGGGLVPPLNTNASQGQLTGTMSSDGTFRGELTVAAGIERAVFASARALDHRSHLANISTRGLVRPSADPMIAGFVVTGNETQSLLLRAIGPTLQSFSVNNAAEAVRLELYQGSAVTQENWFWWSSANAEGLRARMADLGAFPLPGLSLDSVLEAEVTPGLYTAMVRPAAETDGIALVEIYDAEEQDRAARKTYAVNLSTRGFAGQGEESLIAGFVIVGEVPHKVLLRAVGPGLEPLHVTAFATDPEMEVYHGSQVIATNDDWGTNPDVFAVQAAFSSTGAFSLAPASKDAAHLLWLEPGIYTAVVRGKPGADGTTLVEVYSLP